MSSPPVDPEANVLLTLVNEGISWGEQEPSYGEFFKAMANQLDLASAETGRVIQHVIHAWQSRNSGQSLAE